MALLFTIGESQAISHANGQNSKHKNADCKSSQEKICGVWHLQTADRRLETADCSRLQTVDRRLQTADCRLQTADCMRHIKVMFPTYVDRRKLGSCKSRNVGNIKTFIIPLLLTSSKYIYCFRFGSTLDKRKLKKGVSKNCFLTLSLW